jgi:hypothetical protein
LRLFTRRRFPAIRICGVVPFLAMILLFPFNVSASGPNVLARANVNSQKIPTGTAQISGHVYRADTGAPLAKGQVTLIPVTGTAVHVTGERRFTLTNGDGAYEFSQVAAGTYTVAARLSGFIGRYFDDVTSEENARILTISAGDNLDKIDIRLGAAGVISGTVLDEENRPLPYANVQAMRVRYIPGGQRTEAARQATFTDDLGNFRLFGLPPGNYYVRIETSRVNPQTGKIVDRIMFYPGSMAMENAQPLKVNAGDEISGIHYSAGIPESYSVSGNIVDTSGTAGQRKFIIAIQRMNVGDSPRPSTSTTSGSFTISGITSGEYLLSATAALPEHDSRSNDFRNNNEMPELSGLAIIKVSDGDTRANIAVSLPAAVTGRVVTDKPSAPPVPGIIVIAQPEIPSVALGANGFNINNETDLNGVFKIPYLPNGNYEFDTYDNPGMYLKKAVCNGKDYTFLPLTIQSGIGVNDCVLTMGTDAGSVKGQVLDGDKPVPGRVVIAIPEDLSLRQLERFTFTGNTNANGEFQLTGIIPGDYLLFAVPLEEDQSYFDINFADRNQRDAERVSVKSGETKTLTLKPSTPQ